MGPMLAPSLFRLQTRPTPPHLTSAMAENILAAACESETRKAAKRMRLEIYQSSQVPATAATTGAASGQPGRAGLIWVWTEGAVMGTVGRRAQGEQEGKDKERRWVEVRCVVLRAPQTSYGSLDFIWRPEGPDQIC